MSPEIYFDLQAMSRRAKDALSLFYMSVEERDARMAFGDECREFANEIWARYHFVDHSGREVL